MPGQRIMRQARLQEERDRRFGDGDREYGLVCFARKRCSERARLERFSTSCQVLELHMTGSIIQ